MFSAVVSAVFHTLVPDHEIPLTMISRTQDWSMKKMVCLDPLLRTEISQ